MKIHVIEKQYIKIKDVTGNKIRWSSVQSNNLFNVVRMSLN